MSETVDQLRIHDRWKVLDAENLLSQKFDYMEFNKVLDTFSNHSTTIINYFEERLTNASAKSFNANTECLPKKTISKFFEIASFCCDSDRIQTCNLLIRSQMLYSVELRSHLYFLISDSHRIQTYNLLIRSQMLYSVELGSRTSFLL